MTNPFKSIAQAYIRWRHSRGFGIHSPFAYDLVKSVISPGPYGYYGYDDIDFEFQKLESQNTTNIPYDPLIRHYARLLLRLAVFLRPRGILFSPITVSVFDVAARAAGVETTTMTLRGKIDSRHGNIDSLKGYLAVGLGDFPVWGTISRLLSGGTAVLIIDPSYNARDEILSYSGRGLLLEGTRTLLSIPRDDMAPTRYSMRF